MIETDKRMDDTTMARYRSEFREMYGGDNRGTPAVMIPGHKLVPMQSNTMEQAFVGVIGQNMVQLALGRPTMRGDSGFDGGVDVGSSDKRAVFSEQTSSI